MKFLFFFLSLNCFAQVVHINELDAEIKTPPIEGVTLHGHNPFLIKSQIEFQNKVFTRAQVTSKIQSLDFEQKEDLLETLEEDNESAFLKKYPQFQAPEVKRMKSALYE